MDTEDNITEIVLSSDEMIQLLLEGGDLTGVTTADDYELNIYNANAAEVLNRATAYLSAPTKHTDIDEYYAERNSTWFIPDKYKSIDLLPFLLDLCHNDESRARVEQEFAMYLERDLEDVLRFCIYLVDHMRKNNILWGLGRGSSVSSYILFLIGIHKINSIEYNLDVTEFLR